MAPRPMKVLWGAWDRTDDGWFSAFKQYWICDANGHDAGPDEERCRRCGARRVKLTVRYPGVKGTN